MIIIFLVIIDVELDDTKNTNDSRFLDNTNDADVINSRILDNTNNADVIDSRISDDTNDTNNPDVIDS